jgi:hypothetical protein
VEREKKSELNRKLRKLAIEKKLKPPTLGQRLSRAKRAKAKAKEAESRTLTAAGLAPAFAAKLQAATRQAATDPKARALIEKARLAKRIDIAKRENGIGKPAPTRFMGATVPEYEAAVDSHAGAIPPRLTDTRKPTEEGKKGKRR